MTSHIFTLWHKKYSRYEARMITLWRHICSCYNVTHYHVMTSHKRFKKLSCCDVTTLSCYDVTQYHIMTSHKHFKRRTWLASVLRSFKSLRVARSAKTKGEPSGFESGISAAPKGRSGASHWEQVVGRERSWVDLDLQYWSSVLHLFNSWKKTWNASCKIFVSSNRNQEACFCANNFWETSMRIRDHS